MIFEEFKKEFEQRLKSQLIPAHFYCLHKKEDNRDALFLSTDDITKGTCALCNHVINLKTDTDDIIDIDDINAYFDTIVKNLTDILDFSKLYIDATNGDDLSELYGFINSVNGLILSFNNFSKVISRSYNEYMKNLSAHEMRIPESFLNHNPIVQPYCYGYTPFAGKGPFDENDLQPEPNVAHPEPGVKEAFESQKDDNIEGLPY